jgi:hypothetical protein
MTNQNPFKKILREEGLPYKKLLGTASTKTVKGEKLGYMTAILYLTPNDDICALAKLAGCMEGCLYTSGRGAFNSVQKARQAKTDFWYSNRRAFLLSLCADIWTLKWSEKAREFKLLVRLNGTSDIPWENYTIPLPNGTNETIFQIFSDTQFYDYTKHPSRNLQGKIGCDNYDLTYSFSSITPKPISIKGLTNPNNSRVAVVFQKREEIPSNFRNWQVIDGDDTDIRHIEPKQVVVALYAKGKAKKDQTGFVQIKGVHYA